MEPTFAMNNLANFITIANMLIVGVFLLTLLPKIALIIIIIIGIIYFVDIHASFQTTSHHDDDDEKEEEDKEEEEAEIET